MKIFCVDFNGVMQGIKKSGEFELVSDPRKADVLVLWNDVRGDMLELCQINKEHLHKPVVVVQHGAGATRDYLPPEKFPLWADKFCCWGSHDVERLEKAGHKDKAVLTGSPLISSLKPHEKHDDINIIFCPIVAMHEEPANLVTFYELKKIELAYSQKLLIKHKEQLRDTWNSGVITPDTSDDIIPYYDINKTWRLISKLTPVHDKGLYLGSVSMSNPNSATHIEDCVRLLTQTDIVIGMVEGTFQLLAMAMGIPVIICRGWDFKIYGGKDYSQSELIQTDGVTYCDIGDLQRVIEQELANPKRLDEQRKQVVLRELGDITSDPTGNIIKVIKEQYNGQTIYNR